MTTGWTLQRNFLTGAVQGCFVMDASSITSDYRRERKRKHRARLHSKLAWRKLTANRSYFISMNCVVYGSIQENPRSLTRRAKIVRLEPKGSELDIAMTTIGE